MTESMEEAAMRITQAKTGFDETKVVTEVSTPSPFEQAKSLRDDMAKLLEETKKERALMERDIQELTLAGRSYGGSKPVEKTKDDIATEDANKFLKMFNK